MNKNTQTKNKINWSVPWGIIADAHGNPYGLRKVIEKLQVAGAQQFFFLGDAVGYLPMAAEVLALLQHHQVISICGNHDAMLLGKHPLETTKDKIYGLAATKQRLDETWQNYLATWPTQLSLTHPKSGQKFLLVHGGPDDPWGQYVYPDSDLTTLASNEYQIIFLGQTHRPFVRKCQQTLFVNPGSCGLPRDQGHLAAGALFDPWTLQVEIIRVAFDVAKVIAAAEQIQPVAEAVKKCLLRSSLCHHHLVSNRHTPSQSFGGG